MCSLCGMREIDDDKACRKAKNSYTLNLASTYSNGLGPICIRGSSFVIQSCTPASCLCNVIRDQGRFVLTSCWLASLGKKDLSGQSPGRSVSSHRFQLQLCASWSNWSSLEASKGQPKSVQNVAVCIWQQQQHLQFREAQAERWSSNRNSCPNIQLQPAGESAGMPLSPGVAAITVPQTPF